MARRAWQPHSRCVSSSARPSGCLDDPPLPLTVGPYLCADSDLATSSTCRTSDRGGLALTGLSTAAQPAVEASAPMQRLAAIWRQPQTSSLRLEGLSGGRTAWLAAFQRTRNRAAACRPWRIASCPAVFQFSSVPRCSVFDCTVSHSTGSAGGSAGGRHSGGSCAGRPPHRGTGAGRRHCESRHVPAGQLPEGADWVPGRRQLRKESRLPAGMQRAS